MFLYNVGKGVFSLCLILLNPKLGKDKEKTECKIPRRIRTQTPSKIFEKKGVENFVKFHFFDIATKYMVVAATDNIFLLHISTLEAVESSVWAPGAEIKAQCLGQRHTKDECRNHIKVMHVLKGNLFICGTFANNPSCNWRELRNLPKVQTSLNGYQKAPFTSTHQVTSFLTEDEFLYAGTSTDAFGLSWGIMKSSARNSQPGVTTMIDNAWLWGPSFISSFEYENHVYFLLNEKAAEASDSGKIFYPRIVRVCKKDEGSKRSVTKKIWVTFQKARLECSKPGSNQFYFNDLKDVVFIPKEKIFYGLFSTEKLGISGSAVCVYKMDSVNKAFNGPFAVNEVESCEMKQADEDMANFNCLQSEMDKELQQESPRTFKYHQMYDFVKPDESLPLISSDYNRLHFMDVTIVPTSLKQNIHVVFLADENGLVSKLSILPGQSKDTKTSCLLDVFRLALSKTGPKIQSMKYLDLTKSLYIGTKDKLMRVNVSKCQRFKTESSCLSSGDPHCGWNTKESKCTIAPNDNPSDSSWKQKELVCPSPSFEDTKKPVGSDSGEVPPEDVEYPEYPNGTPEPGVNGEWTTWSNWMNCGPGGRFKLRRKIICLFRERLCRNSTKCPGVRIQVQGRGGRGWREGISVQKALVFSLLTYLNSEFGSIP